MKKILILLVINSMCFSNINAQSSDEKDSQNLNYYIKKANQFDSLITYNHINKSDIDSALYNYERIRQLTYILGMSDFERATSSHAEQRISYLYMLTDYLNLKISIDTYKYSLKILEKNSNDFNANTIKGSYESQYDDFKPEEYLPNLLKAISINTNNFLPYYILQ